MVYEEDLIFSKFSCMEEVLPSFDDSIKNYVSHIIHKEVIAKKDKIHMFCVVNDFLDDHPMYKQNLIVLIENIVYEWLQTMWKSCNKSTQLVFIGELYYSFETIANSIKNTFFMLRDPKNITTTYCFEDTIDSIWKKFFKSIVVEYDLKRQLSDWLTCLLLGEDNEINSFCSLLNFLSKTTDRGIGDEVITEVVNNITDIFDGYTKGMTEEMPYSMLVFDFYTKTMDKLKSLTKQYLNHLSVFMLYKLVCHQLQQIFKDLEVFWENEEINLLTKLIGLLNNSPLTNDEIKQVQEVNIISSKKHINKKVFGIKEVTLDLIVNLFEDHYQLQKLEKTIYFSKIVLKEFFNEWELFRIKENDIMMDLVKTISQVIDSGEKDDIIKKFNIVEILPNKELFAIIYWKLLYTKFINSKIKNIELELFFINAFRSIVDQSTSKKIVDLIRDYRTTASYAGKISSIVKLPFKLTTSIFSISQTDQTVLTQVELPTIMSDVINQMKTLFLKTNEHKKITFTPTHSYCILNYSNSDGNNFLIHLNTIQASILLLFNEKQIVSNEEVMKMSSNTDLLLKMINLLIGNKIVKENNGQYQLDNSFNPPTKVTNLLVCKGVSSNQKKVDITVDMEQFKFNKVICLIMKLMKKDKTKLFDVLQNELQEQFLNNFNCDLHITKRAVEYLISKGFIERSAEDQSNLCYCP